MTIRLILCIWSLSLLPLSGSSQQFQPFSQAEGWQSVSTDHFDVMYKGANQTSAQQVARYAEMARYELGILFDYKPESRFTLMVLAQPMELLYTNLQIDAQEQAPGIFQMPDYHTYVVHPGTQEGLYDETRRQVARLILQEFTFGDRISRVIQTQLLLHLPAWFQEGLIDYVGNGWTYEDEVWVNSLDLESQNLVQMALEGEGYINRILRKSIWHYIVQEYGEQKLSEIIYLVNIAHSVESGLIQVLGINLNTLTLRWQQHFRKRAADQAQGRFIAEEAESSVRLPAKEGYRLLSFTYSEARREFAVYLEKNGKQTVFLFDPESRSYTSTNLRSGYQTPDAVYFRFQPPMAWSHDGDFLVTTVYRKGRYQLAYLKAEDGSVTYKKLPADIQRIQHLAWSHDGEQLVSSALRDGHLDLFLLKAGGAEFRALTADAYDDVDPVWSLDDQFILFSSNRDSLSIQSEGPDWQGYQRSFDLYKYPVQEASPQLEALTSTPAINERHPQPVSSYEALYQTDESGIYNLIKINIFLREIDYMTDLYLGLPQFQVSNQHLVWAIPQAGQLTLFHTPLDGMRQRKVPEATLLRLDYIAAYQARLREEQFAQAAEVATELPGQGEGKTLPEPAEPVADSTVVEAPEQQVHYYIFDEDDELYAVDPNEKIESAIERADRDRFIPTIFGNQPKPDLAEISVSRPKKASNRWSADYVGLGLNWDPIPRNFKVGLDLGIGFSDMLKHHRVDARLQPFFNFKNGFADLKYTYQKHRLDVFATAGFRGRTYQEFNLPPNDSTLYRFDQLSLGLGARYPLSSFAAAEVQAGWYRIDRKDLTLRQQGLLNDLDQVFRMGFTLRLNTVQQREGYRYKGVIGEASWDSYYSTAEGKFAFHRLRAQGTYYRELYKKIVLVGRMAASFNLPISRIQYYMGGVDDQLVPLKFQKPEDVPLRRNAVDSSLHSFHFMEFVMPVRGFDPITREGSRYLVANLELRIPISRLLKYSLTSNALYHLELIPFLDAGTVWVDGNPFSKKRPTDTQIISTGNLLIKLQTLKSPFLIGFGTGIRTNILGYSLRTDIAWGIDDSTLKAPILTLSVGKKF